MPLLAAVLPLHVIVRTDTGFEPDLVTSAALLAALVYAVRSARQAGLDTRSMYWAVVSATLAGMFGGHLLDLFVHGWQGLSSLLRFWKEAKSLYGGLIVGGIVGGLFFRYRKLPVLAYADASMPALALGYAIGRIGCFLNGDDYGALTRLPWAVVYPPGTEAYAAHLSRGWIAPAAPVSLPVHPAQLYASLLGLGMFVLLANWRAREPGDRLCLFLCLYGAARFSMEWLRGDFRAVLGPLSLPQLFSLLFIAVGLALWLGARRPLEPALA